MSSPLIDVQSVSYTVPDKTIINNVSFAIGSDQIVSIIGYNGSGKSTLLKLLVGSLTPTGGSITKQPGLRVGYVPQKLSFTTSLPITVQDFLGMYNDSTTGGFTCSLLNITPLLSQPLHSLSGGQLQKVLIYNALLGSPQVLLLDEPTAGLDILAQKEFYALIEHIRTKHKISIVLVSHDVHTVYSESGLVVCLHQGSCCHGSPEQPGFSDEMKQLFGSYVTPYLHTHMSDDR